MAKLRRISDRNQITLPPSVLRDAGVGPGELFSIEARDGVIILEPKRLADDALAPEDWSALDKLVRRQTKAKDFTEYSSPFEARKHLRRPRA